MALYDQQQLSTRPLNKASSDWQINLDDLFNDLINPEAYQSPTEEFPSTPTDSIQVLDFLTTEPSSNSDSSPFSQDGTEAFRKPLASPNSLDVAQRHSASPALRVVASHSQSPWVVRQQDAAASATHLSLMLDGGSQIGCPLSSFLRPSSTSPFPNHDRLQNSKLRTPLPIRKKHPSPPLPSTKRRVEKSRRRNSPPLMATSSQQRQMQQQVWDRELNAANSGHYDAHVSPHNAPPSPPSSVSLKQEQFANYNLSTAGLPWGSFPGSTEAAMSPLANGYVQHPNTPVASPSYEHKSSAQSTTEASEMGTYTSAAVRQDSAIELIMTPPTSHPITAGQWHRGSRAASPDFAARASSVDKAEQAAQAWGPRNNTTGSRNPDESTCGASDSNLVGLGITTCGLQPVVNASPAAKAPTAESQNSLPTDFVDMVGEPHSQQHHARPIVRQQLHAVSQPQNFSHPTTPSSLAPPTPYLDKSPSCPTSLPSPFSASASPATAQHHHYPISPLQNHPSYFRHSYQAPQPTFYRQAQRHGSYTAPISIGVPVNSGMRSASTPNARTPSLSPQPPHDIASSHHRRSHSGGHKRRPSGARASSGHRQASVDFVNYTPMDSQKILTGVAPSGSSKTKARREKEAAEKRRRLSEAAKKAVLDAGGDWSALEREGLLALMEREA